VTVLERREKPGGQLHAALPVYRLPRRVLEKDIELIREAGVEIVCGVTVGEDMPFSDLRREFAAVVVATGLPLGRVCNVPGAEHPNVVNALCFLEKAAAGDRVAIGRRVVVIGGGDVAMDAARTARRHGASEVTVVCLEAEDKIPAHRWEVEESREEGVTIIPGYGPWAMYEGDGQLAVVFKKVISIFNETGRFDPRFAEEGALTLTCDDVIAAIGQGPDYSFLQGAGVEMSMRGPVWDQDTMMLSVPGVFMCGEAARGPGAAVEAVAGGLAAGARVAAWLGVPATKMPPEPGPVIGPVPERETALIRRLERIPVPMRPAEERVRQGRVPVELGFAEEGAVAEGSRCMGCGLGAVVSRWKCQACLTCVRLCPYGVPRVGGTAHIAPEECQACGICAAACPAGAISLAKPAAGCRGAVDLLVLACEKSRFGVQQALDSLPRRPDYGLVTLPSPAAVDTLTVLQALENGAGTVMVFTCGKDRCVHGCLEAVNRRVAATRRTMEEIGLAAERLVLVEGPADRWQLPDTLLPQVLADVS